MVCNVGRIERAVRVFVGLILLGIALFHVVAGAVAILAYVVGTIGLVSGVIGFCPAWAVFGINTCGPKRVEVKAGGPAR